MLPPWLSLLASLAPAVQEQESLLDSGLVRAVELAPPPGTLVEYLRLDAERASADGFPLALLRYVAGPDPEGGLRVELELDFLAEGLRVIHVERARRGERQVVFREVREGAGRTLLLQGAPEEGFDSYELGWKEVVRHVLPAGGEFPLLLVESVRRGLVPPGEARVFDPLGSCFEVLRLSTRGEPAERSFEARRGDGSLRWRVGFRGERCSEWRWREGGPPARAIPREEYEQVRSAHELAARAAREASAAARGRPVLPR